MMRPHMSYHRQTPSPPPKEPNPRANSPDQMLMLHLWYPLVRWFSTRPSHDAPSVTRPSRPQATAKDARRPRGSSRRAWTWRSRRCGAGSRCLGQSGGKVLGRCCEGLGGWVEMDPVLIFDRVVEKWRRETPGKSGRKSQQN